MAGPSSRACGREYSNGELVARLLAMASRYWPGCLRVLAFQVTLLTLGLSGLSLTGLGIDFLREQVEPGARPTKWPFGVRVPEGWPPLAVVGLIGGMILALALMRSVLNYLYTVAGARLVHAEIVVQLRSQVYDKLQRLSFRFFDENMSGSIINRVTGDVQAVRMFVDGVILQGVIMALSLAVYLTYMIQLHPRLTAACLATTPLIWITAALFARHVRPLYAHNRELVDRMILRLSETIQGILTIKCFAREPEERAKFTGAAATVRDQQRKIFWKVSVFTPAVGFMAQVNLFILLLYGGHLVIRGELPLGTGLIVFAGLLQQFSGQISNISNITNSVQQSLIAARRVFEVLDAPIDIRSKPNAHRARRARGGIRFDKAEFEFDPDEPVIHGVDLEIKAGQCVAVLGPTGSGKSMLMSLVPRFYDVTRGAVRVDGIDVRDWHLDDLRRQIGMVFQESFLFSTTVAANIAFGHPDAGLEQIEKAARVAAADEFIRGLPKGYDSVLGEGAVNLSGGQRQRLAIARAVLLEPPILLLDDPTAAVDAETEHEILEAMDRAITGRTTLVVAHRLSTLRRADFIVVLDRGRIVQRGTHDELMAAKGPYRAVASLQLIDDAEREALLGAEGAP